ncbi:unnamed protein product [Closterium sp. Yama58-4]|nr:unnamed protein product [Closterium sp. Yama58-4]
MSNYKNQSPAARFAEVGREGYQRLKKTAAVMRISTARVAERVRRVASTFLSSTGLKPANRRRSAASSVPRATSPVPRAIVAFRRSMRGWTAAFAFKLRKPSSSEATTRSYSPQYTASSAAASRAATSAYAVFCPSAPVAPVDSPHDASTASFASSSASSATSAGANQSASSTSSAAGASACSALTRNASENSKKPASSASSFPARSSHADLRVGPTPPATSAAAIPPLALASVKADSHADSHADFNADSQTTSLADCRAEGSSSWKRAMSIAIPACDGDDEAQGAGEDEGGERQEPGSGEAGEEAEEMAESNGLGGGAPDSAVDIDSLWEAAAAAELEAEERAVTAAAMAAASGAKRWRESWKSLTPRCNAVPKAPRSDLFGSKTPAQTPALTPRGLVVEPKNAWSALAESVASDLADNQIRAELADGAAGLVAPRRGLPTTPRLSFRQWRSTSESTRPRARAAAEEEFAEMPRNWLENAWSGGNTGSAVSPPPPSTPRFLSAVRSSFKRSASEAAPGVVAGSNPSASATVTETAISTKIPCYSPPATSASGLSPPAIPAHKSVSCGSLYEHHHNTAQCRSMECSSVVRSRQNTTRNSSTLRGRVKPSKSANSIDVKSTCIHHLTASNSSSFTPSLRARRGLPPFENLCTEEEHPGQARQPNLLARNGTSAPDLQVLEFAQVSSNLPGSSKRVPALSWGQLSELAAGREKMDRRVLSGGAVTGCAVEEGTVHDSVVEWCAMEDDDSLEEPESPAMVPACSLCGVRGFQAPPLAQQDRQQIWHMQQQGRLRQKEEDEEGQEQHYGLADKQPGCAAGMGCAPISMSRTTVVRYVPRFGRHGQQRSVVREVAREAVRNMVGVGAR